MTSGDKAIFDYLAKGGRLTSPANAPQRYRAELMKIMATFVDSELAGAAGFADRINAGPGMAERIAATRIVLEKTVNAGKVLRLMGEFGANIDRYAGHHPWTDRLPRNTSSHSGRSRHDMRLSVLNYPLQGWSDAVVMNCCMGLGVCVQLEELCAVSYQPLADVFRDILEVERRHVELAERGIEQLLHNGEGSAVNAGLDYWVPRVSAMFGDVSEARMAQLKRWGLRRSNGGEMRQRWTQSLRKSLDGFGLKMPTRHLQSADSP